MSVKPHKRALRLVIWIISIGFIAFVGLHLSFVFYFNGKICRDLQKEFLRQTHGEYELQIEKLVTNIFLKSVYLKGINVSPVAGLRTEATKYHISAANINLENFSLFLFLTQRDMKFKRLELAEPKVIIFRNNVDIEPDHPKVKKAQFSLYMLLKNHIHSLSVRKIQMRNAEIKVYVDDKDSILLLNSKDNELHISELSIDEVSERAGHLFLAEKIQLAIHKFSFTTLDSLYTVRVSKVFASYTDSSVSMDSVRLIPNYSRRHFAGAAGEQTDRMKISALKVEFNRMDVKLFFEKNWFIARQLKITNFNLEAYRDKNDSRKPHTPRSIQALIKNIPVYIRIDSICVNHAKCTYEEVAEGASEPGKISFNNVHAVITGFTNRQSGNAKYAVLAVHASCMLMNTGKLRVYYGFPLNTEKMVFDCSGYLQGMPFTELNKVLEPIAKVSILQGEIDSMIFSFHAGDVSSEGTMKLLYHDLKIQILKKKDKLFVREQLLSFLAHRLIIKEQNPSGNRPVRITRIHHRRDEDRFIFNYSLKSILSGIKTTIGMPDSDKMKIIDKLKGKRKRNRD